MPARQATTLAQRREMLRLVEDEGYTYAAVAEQVGVSFWSARKWIRRGRRESGQQLRSSGQRALRRGGTHHALQGPAAEEATSEMGRGVCAQEVGRRTPVA